MHRAITHNYVRRIAEHQVSSTLHATNHVQVILRLECFFFAQTEKYRSRNGPFQAITEHIAIKQLPTTDIIFHADDVVKVVM